MRKIVVADDDPGSRHLLREILEGLQCEVSEAVDGSDALLKVAEVNPDILLLDLQMPQLDGFDVVARLRQIPNFAALPVIAVTALAAAEDQEKCLRSGFTAFVSKPINIPALRQIVTHWLG